MVIERVFMQETLDGYKNPISSIEVTFKEMTSEVSGITMIYQSGDSSTLGTRGNEPQVIDLSASEKLARVEIAGTQDDLIVSISVSRAIYLMMLSRNH